MTDDLYLPEWDDERRDCPRFGGVPLSSRPTTSERALVADLVHRYVNPDDDSFPEAFLHFCVDRHADRRWQSVFLALLEAFAATALGAQGQKLTVARAADDVKAAREDILEFGGQP